MHLLFPPRASTSAGQVDALYGYLLLVSGVMTLLIFVTCHCLCDPDTAARTPTKYRRKHSRIHPP